MSNFSEQLLDILNEQGKSYKDLENANIISKRSYYQYKTYTPFLPTILKIANYLNVSLDYLSGRKSENYFKKYKIEQNGFYNNLSNILEKLKISQSKFSEDLSIGRTNFTYWKQGSFPKYSMLIDIANYLNCDIDELLDVE